MTTSVLNREVASEGATYSIPLRGEHYAPTPEKDENGRILITTVQTIQSDPGALYALWRDVSLIPRWQEHVISVTQINAVTSHWVMGNPEAQGGKRVEFDSMIFEEVQGAKLAWKSIRGDVEQTGVVTFAPAASGRGTLVTLNQSMKVSLGLFGNAVAGIVERSPRQTAIEDLRHFKQLAETGEIPSVKGQPHGPRGVTGGIKEWMYGDTNPTPPGTNVNE